MGKPTTETYHWSCKLQCVQTATAGVGLYSEKCHTSYISGSVATAVAGRALLEDSQQTFGAGGGYILFVLGLTTTWATAAAVLAGQATGHGRVMNERQERSAKVVETADMTTRMAKAGTYDERRRNSILTIGSKRAVQSAKNTAYTVVEWSRLLMGDKKSEG